MVVWGEMSSQTIIDYHAPFDRSFRLFSTWYLSPGNLRKCTKIRGAHTCGNFSFREVIDIIHLADSLASSFIQNSKHLVSWLISKQKTVQRKQKYPYWEKGKGRTYFILVQNHMIDCLNMEVFFQWIARYVLRTQESLEISFESLHQIT